MSYQPNQPDPRLPEYQQAPGQPLYEGQPSRATDDTVIQSSGGGVNAQSQHESYMDHMGNRVENRSVVFEDENLLRTNRYVLIKRIVYYVLAVLEIILALRFLFRLFGASESSGFITFLYGLTHPFVGPFNGIFNDQAVGRSVFEFSTIVAMIVYALIAWGIVSLSRVILTPNYDGHRSTTTTRRRTL